MFFVSTSQIPMMENVFQKKKQCWNSLQFVNQHNFLYLLEFFENKMQHGRFLLYLHIYTSFIDIITIIYT